jgi:O-antigen ligase
MDAEALPIVKHERHAAVLDAVIEKGIVFLLIFTPLAIGTVHVWSAAVMELAAFLVLAAWFMKSGNAGVVMLPNKALFLLFGIFIALITAQLIPMPSGLLHVLSPNTDRFYERFSDSGNASWRTLSIYPWATLQELLKLLSYAAIFFVIVNHYRTREQVDSLVRTIVFLAFGLVVFAFVQKFTWNGRLFWLFPLGAHTESTRNFMVWGPFINRNHFAGYLELAIPLGLGMVLYDAAKTDTSRHPSLLRRFAAVIGSKRFSSLVLWFVLSLALIGALFMTLSRGGIIGFLCSAVLFSVLARMRRGLKKKTGILLIAGIVVLLTVVVAGWGRIEGRFGQLGEAHALRRAAVWDDSMGIVRDFPVFGTGFGTFRESYPRYQSHSSTARYDHAHNDYVELLTDAGLTGFLGGIALAAAFFILVLKAWMKRHRTYVKAIGAGGMASLSAIAVHSVTDFNLHIPANALLLSVIAALTYSVVFTVGRMEDA